MSKVVLLSMLLMSGCSGFTFNASMCKKIASEPNQVLPEECKNYNEQEAQKAFDKVKDKKKVLDKEIIEFHQDDEK